MNIVKILLAPSAVFLLLAACRSAPPFKNMVMLPVGSGREALCLIHDKEMTGPDSLWFKDDEGNLCPMHCQSDFGGLNWVLPSPDGTQFALMSSCEGCFELSVFRLSDCLSTRNGVAEDAKPVCSLGEYRYFPDYVRWHGNHELYFFAGSNPRQPDDLLDDSPHQWKWNIESDKIEEVK